MLCRLHRAAIEIRWLGSEGAEVHLAQGTAVMCAPETSGGMRGALWRAFGTSCLCKCRQVLLRSPLQHSPYLVLASEHEANCNL
jgi:hypothetical protein